MSATRSSSALLFDSPALSEFSPSSKSPPDALSGASLASKGVEFFLRRLLPRGITTSVTLPD